MGKKSSEGSGGDAWCQQGVQGILLMLLILLLIKNADFLQRPTPTPNAQRSMAEVDR